MGNCCTTKAVKAKTGQQEANRIKTQDYMPEIKKVDSVETNEIKIVIQEQKTVHSTQSDSGSTGMP